MIISTNSQPVTIENAASLLRSGQVCAFATETVYGLGADATNSDAVLAIYATKGRPRFNPLIVHCVDMAMVEQLVEVSSLARRLATFWPGPLTLVLPMRPDAGISDIVTAGLPTLAVRIPAHPQARELIAEVGRPLAAPSANPSGRLSPTTAEQVIAGFRGAVPVFDAGPCNAGLESTIIALDGEHLVQLRAGALAREEIEEALGLRIIQAGADSPIASPGMLKNHYAPETAIRLNATELGDDEVFLAFGPVPDGVVATENLSVSGDLKEAARNLFGALHQLDQLGKAGIAVAVIPQTGLGEAINDRLRRAAAPRD